MGANCLLISSLVLHPAEAGSYCTTPAEAELPDRPCLALKASCNDKCQRHGGFCCMGFLPQAKAGLM